MDWKPFIYTRLDDDWGVLHRPTETVIAEDCNKGEAAGFAMILNGNETAGWECVGYKTKRRQTKLAILRSIAVNLR